MEPDVTEKVAGESLKAAGLAEWVGQRGDLHRQSCDIILWWLEDLETVGGMLTSSSIQQSASQERH